HLESPILPIAPFSLRNFSCIELLKRNDTVMNMPCFVRNHIPEQFFQQRLTSQLANCSKSAKSKSLDHDLHSQKFHIPSGIAHDGINYYVKVVIDLVKLFDFLSEIGV